MGNWKELGEVPDSDDEGLDSQEWPIDDNHSTTPQPPPPDPGRNSHQHKNDDIWRIPYSSPCGGASRRKPSFRPPKPIQEHPYLLESAQYAQVMKSHGIKPIKVAIPQEQAVADLREEDSQEQDSTLSNSPVGIGKHTP